MQGALAALVQRGGQAVQQRRQHAGVGRGLAGKGGGHVILGRQRLDGVLAGRRVQQVGGQLAVKAQRAAQPAVVQRQAVQRLGVKGPQLGVAFQQGGQLRLVGQKHLATLHGVPCAVLVLRQAGAAGQRGGQRGGGHGVQRGGFCSGRAAVLQLPAVDELVHLQPGQAVGGGRRVAGAAGVGGGVGLDGRILADGAQHVGKLGLVAVGAQLGALPRLDGGVVEVVVDALQAAEFLDQRQRGLFANARHAGDVVGAVAHQALDVDELRRFQAVFFADGGRVHRQRLAVGGQQHGGGGVHQLQAVAVAGRQQRRAALRLAGGGQRAQNIVGLPAGSTHLHKAQLVQQRFQHRHLLGQFLGHAVAGGLVAVVGFVAERRRALIPGDGHGVGRVGRQQVEQDILEPVDGVCVAAVLRRQQLDAKKRPVHQAVAVQYHQFHNKTPLKKAGQGRAACGCAGAALFCSKYSIPQTPQMW